MILVFYKYKVALNVLNAKIPLGGAMEAVARPVKIYSGLSNYRPNYRRCLPACLPFGCVGAEG